jgi:ribosomal protein S18 acetylase RimI-like enzyme
VERGVDDLHVLGAFRAGKCVGYGMVEPDTGDVAQLAVAKASRRQGVARALFAAMVRLLPAHTGTLRVLNVDAESDDDLAFYDELGADEFVRQFEMHRVI